MLPPAGYNLRYVKIRSATVRKSVNKLQILNTIEPHAATSEGNPQLHTEVALMLCIECYLVLNLMRISLLEWRARRSRGSFAVCGEIRESVEVFIG